MVIIGMTGKRFKIYNKETLDTRIEDTMDCYSDGTPKSYWFGENEDFCDLFKKLETINKFLGMLKKIHIFNVKMCIGFLELPHQMPQIGWLQTTEICS